MAGAEREAADADGPLIDDNRFRRPLHLPVDVAVRPRKRQRGVFPVDVGWLWSIRGALAVCILLLVSCCERTEHRIENDGEGGNGS